MPYVCKSPESYSGKRVGNGQCAIFVQEAAGAPNTQLWKAGDKVKGTRAISRGTAIATFDTDGKYPSNKTGNHAAIYMSQDSHGIWVYDQGRSQGRVEKRQIRFKGGQGSPSNDGDAFSIITSGG
jgi:hypothetical protein